MAHTERCDRCGGRLACWYTKRTEALAMCHTCSNIYGEALTEQGWRILVVEPAPA